MLPKGIRGKLGSLQSRLPLSWRRGKPFAEAHELAKSSESWSLEESQDHQLRQLRLVLHNAASDSPFYEQRFIRKNFRPEYVQSLGDFQQCPQLEYSDWIEKVRASQPNDPEHPTTNPMADAFQEVVWARAGYKEGARLATLANQAITSLQARNPLPHILGLTFDAQSPALAMEALERLRSFSPKFLCVSPAILGHLFNTLSEQGQPWPVPLETVLCGPVALPLKYKRAWEEALGTRIHRWFRSADDTLIAGEGSQSEPLYFPPAFGYVEFGNTDESGRRELIVTSFAPSPVPVIRLKSGVFADALDTGDPADREFPWPCAMDIDR